LVFTSFMFILSTWYWFYNIPGCFHFTVGINNLIMTHSHFCFSDNMSKFYRIVCSNFLDYCHCFPCRVNKVLFYDYMKFLCQLLSMTYHVSQLFFGGEIIIISFWSIGHPWRASRHCGLQLSLWPHSMIFLCFLSHPLLFFAMFSSAYLSFCNPEDSNLIVFPIAPVSLCNVCPIQFHFLEGKTSVKYP